MHQTVTLRFTKGRGTARMPVSALPSLKYASEQKSILHQMTKGSVRDVLETSRNNSLGLFFVGLK